MTTGLILAAGRGSRMKEATNDKPKCLIELAGKPLLEWQLAALSRGGVNDITIARGYKAELLTGNFETVDNPDWDKTNMVSTFKCALRHIDADCVISYSDIVYHWEHIAKLSSSNADIAIAYDTEWEALWKLRFENPLEDAETFKERDGYLLEIGNRTDRIEEIEGQFMGLLYFSSAGLKIINNFLEALPEKDIAKLDMTAMLQLLLKSDIPIATIPVSGKWCEADSMQDIEVYESTLKHFLNKKKPWSHDWRV